MLLVLSEFLRGRETELKIVWCQLRSTAVRTLAAFLDTDSLAIFLSIIAYSEVCLWAVLKPGAFSLVGGMMAARRPFQTAFTFNKMAKKRTILTLCK